MSDKPDGNATRYHEGTSIAFWLAVCMIVVQGEFVVPAVDGGQITVAILIIVAMLTAVMVPLIHAQRETRRHPDQWKSGKLTIITWVIVGLNILLNLVGLSSYAAWRRTHDPRERERFEREMERRAQARNHEKQLVRALHDYHDWNAHFPAGTHPNPKLKPEKRLSWMADVLPFVSQAALHKTIDFGKAWGDPANRNSVTTKIPAFLAPGATQSTNGPYPVTSYIGVAGLGVEGPTLPLTSPKAGCFAYDRVTGFKNILDGKSNTIILMDVSKDCGPWAAGGRPTIRALTRQPYINGPDGFGGNYPGVVMAATADGSVHAFSQKIDSKLFEKMVTIAGGKRVTKQEWSSSAELNFGIDW